MDRSALISALRDLDAELAEPVEVVVVGGAAMILHFGAARATQDVDVVAVQGNVAAFRRAVEAECAAWVAQKLG